MLSTILGLGLSLLPKIPQAWNTVASIVGKAVPNSVSEAASLASEVITAVKEDKVTPEQKKALEEELNKHEEKIMELVMGEMNSIRDLEKAAYKSNDKYVARTRPMILRRLFYITAGFCIFAPVSVLIGARVGVDMNPFIEMIKCIAEYLFYVFGTAYIGYGAMRTRDKSNVIKNGSGKNGITSLIEAIKK